MTFEERMMERAKARGITGSGWVDTFITGFVEGRADAERELRASMKCGHPLACLVETLQDVTRSSFERCAACERERKLRCLIETWRKFGSRGSYIKTIQAQMNGWLQCADELESLLAKEVGA